MKRQNFNTSKRQEMDTERVSFVHVASSQALALTIRRLDVLTFLLCAFFCTAAAPGADAVEQFLERHGMHELLAVHLEERIESMQAGEARDEIVLRLATIYAQLLDRERDDARRVALEERSRRLLTRAPPNTADELRLALLRASYLRAEHIAEQHRLRLASEGDVARAVSEFASVIEQLRNLATYYDNAIQTTNTRLTRAVGAEATTLFERLNRLERMSGSSRFLLAWSLYYRAFLTGERETAGAERFFADSLLTDVSRPQPQDISQDLRAFEPTARAIVGMALCKSLSSNNSAVAIRWIDLLDDEQTFEAVRAQAPAWTLAIRLEHAEYRHARELLDRQKHERGSLPVLWLRLAAAWALEAERNQSEAQALLQYAVTQLAAAGELQQILMLAERYGAENLGSSAGGFAVRYVNGLIHYREARDLQAEDRYDRSRVRELYEKAVNELDAAMREPDARDHPDAAAACRRLLAWAHFFKGDYLQARAAFESAASESPPAEAAEALWMAIVCLDRLIQSGGNPRLVSERESLIDRFLAKYPSSPRAATLLVNRAAKAEELGEAEIARLLAIPPSHESYDEARRRIAQALYQRFRQARGEARIAAAEAFLGVAAPMLDAPRAFGAGDDEDAVRRRLVHVRRVLEAALHDGVANRAAAMRALAVFGDIESQAPQAAAPHQDEFSCRRLQVHLLDRDLPRAAGLADTLWEREAQAEIWSRLASRAMFQHAHRAWKEGGDASAQTLHHIVRFGGRVLREFDPQSDPGAIGRANVLAYHAAVAEASFVLWREHAADDEGPRALFLYKRMIDQHPRNAAFLRHGAILAGAPQIGEFEFAADCWRMLSAGLSAGSNEWFEARHGLINALAEIDAERARDVMAQHRQLHPEYGPQPWGERLRALDERLGRSRETEANE